MNASKNCEKLHDFPNNGYNQAIHKNDELSMSLTHCFNFQSSHFCRQFGKQIK